MKESVIELYSLKFPVSFAFFLDILQAFQFHCKPRRVSAILNWKTNKSIASCITPPTLWNACWTSSVRTIVRYLNKWYKNIDRWRHRVELASERYIYKTLIYLKIGPKNCGSVWELGDRTFCKQFLFWRNYFEWEIKTNE